MKTEDRKALHDLLDAVIDKIESIKPEETYVEFDISTCTYGVHAVEADKDVWALYRHHQIVGDGYPKEVTEGMIADLNAAEFGKTRREGT